MKGWKNSCLTLLLLSIAACLCRSTLPARVGENVVLRPQPTERPPLLDGVLDDPAWQGRPTVDESFIVNRPVYGEVLPEKTRVWLTYDRDNIYFAFYCHEEQPGRIQGTMTKRDNIFSEDWIDVDLDTMGSRQMVYEHACNPLGVQGDLVNSVAGGESADPDWVWYSAGRIVADGYIVEMRIPLKSLRFRSGDNVTMNLGIYRSVSHSGANASWPQIDQKRGYFNSLVPVVFAHLPSQLRLEALPAATFNSVRDRETPQRWSKSANPWQAGLDLKYGVTPTSNLEVTLNPDFSQVESDQFQVLANQRYPVFYNEKRPFFMETGNQFGLAGATGLGNMRAAVNTRNIVDPAWGAKFVGDYSRVSIGALVAGDEWPGRAWEEGANPELGRNATYFIGRGKYTLGGDNYAGVLYSGREFGDTYNRVVGADAHLRIGGKHNIAVNALVTFSNDPQGAGRTSAGSFTAGYSYSQKPLDMGAMVEDYGRDFRMDSAFYLRTGIRQFAAYVIPRFYPRWRGLEVLKKLSFCLQGSAVHDKFTGRNDSSLLGEVRFDFDSQGFLEVQAMRDVEFWAGTSFVRHRLGLAGGIRPAKWINTHANFSSGEGIYYHPASPYLGRRTDFHTCLFLYAGDRLSQHFSFTHQGFRRRDDASRVYDLNILVSRTTFQFDKHLFVRALVQYDSYYKKIVTDLLASYTLIPGTVLHVGYGALYDKRSWENDAWRSNVTGSEYFQMRRSLFCKVSYRLQF